MLADADPKPAISGIELSLRTRGSQKSIQMDARQTKVSLNGVATTTKTRPARWQNMIGLLNDITLDELATLPVNTERSQVDAAYITHLRVTTPEQTYESPQFDHLSPPRPLAAILNALVAGVPRPAQAAFR